MLGDSETDSWKTVSKVNATSGGDQAKITFNFTNNNQ